MFGNPSPSLPQRIAFLLLPDFSMIAFSSAIEPLRLANRSSTHELYRWRLLSKDGGPVQASNAISVAVDAAMTAPVADDRPQPSALVVCSGVGAERYQDREVFAWLRRQARQGIDIGALCTGSHVLARAGLLDGYRCTIHWENMAGFVEAFPEVEAASDLFEIDRDRFTCSGGTAALDMMLYLVSVQHGEELANRVSEQCILDRVRASHQHQRMPLCVRAGGHHPKLVETIQMMEANLEEPLRPDEIARAAGLSRRHLERLFGRYLGRSPAQYYLRLRLERARQLLYQTDLPVLEVALACGFISASHFSKCYRQVYDKPPRSERTASARAQA